MVFAQGALVAMAAGLFKVANDMCFGVETCVSAWNRDSTFGVIGVE